MTDGLLLVHAFPVDARMWEEQRSLAVPTVAPHLPGFGGTPGAGDVMTMEAAASRCVEALDEAGLDRGVACGLSMGGYVVFELWRRHRERIAGLVLANTRAETDDESGLQRRQALAKRLREEGSGFLVREPPPLLSEAAPETLWARVRDLIAEQPPGAIAAAALGMAARPDSRPDLPGIDVPALVITSSGDMLMPPEVSAPMVKAIPGVVLAVLEGAGHLSNLEAPDEFNVQIETHLRRCGLVR